MLCRSSEQIGYDVTTFKVTWGLPRKARLRLKSNDKADIQKVNSIAAKAANGSVPVTTLITSAATAKRIQSTMKLGTATSMWTLLSRLASI
jgi:hypothetical protein